MGHAPYAAEILRLRAQVEVDLDLNAHANARMHFDSRKAHASKQAKTEAAADKALAAAEKKAAMQLSQVMMTTLCLRANFRRMEKLTRHNRQLAEHDSKDHASTT